MSGTESSSAGGSDGAAARPGAGTELRRVPRPRICRRIFPNDRLHGRRTLRFTDREIPSQRSRGRCGAEEAARRTEPRTRAATDWSRAVPAGRRRIRRGAWRRRIRRGARPARHGPWRIRRTFGGSLGSVRRNRDWSPRRGPIRAEVQSPSGRRRHPLCGEPRIRTATRDRRRRADAAGEPGTGGSTGMSLVRSAALVVRARACPSFRRAVLPSPAE